MQRTLVSFTDDMRGEEPATPTRVVVAPLAGRFEPAGSGELAAGAAVTEGQPIGFVCNGEDRIAVTSPFGGVVERVMAWPTERLRPFQPVLSLRAG